MYLKYWNLNEEPFRQIATDRMVFMSMQYREGLARLFYLFDQKRTAGMITGPYGVGKTLTFEFLRRRALRDKAQVIQIDAIPNGSLPMARHILRCLGLPDAASTLAEALMTLQVHARQSAPRLKHTLLLVDEAQQLVEGDGFYLVHYLCNLRIGEGGEDPLFTTIIAGTDLLREAMKAQDSLRRRIQLDWRLNPLSERETVEYVQHHIAIAGAPGVKRMDAQRIAVAVALRQRLHRRGVGQFHRRNHQVLHARRPRRRPHRIGVGRELGGVEVAVGVYPGGHGGDGAMFRGWAGQLMVFSGSRACLACASSSHF